MALVLFSNLGQEDKADATKRLISGSTPDQDFFFMILLSILMATLGLILNSAAIIIGSMLVAPMLYPILSIALGIIMADFSLIGRSFITLVKSTVIGICAAAVITLFFASRQPELNSEVLLRTDISLAYLAVSIIAGFAASFAMVKPKVSESLPGVAISVALIPPLAVVGIGLARVNWDIARQSFLLFVINIIGVVFAAMINFSLMNFYLERWVAVETVKKEDEKVADEQEVAKLENELGKNQ